ncbi:vinexin-like isoform X4 [Dermacentor albipictus]|uniref:vinexin-like isoform X4 n=1 Tax=Dermacentor albipictus TaxID=60249 RepID=UPI0038FC61F0
MKSFCWRPQFARKKVLFSGEDLQSNAEMSSQAKIRRKKQTLEKISMPNYSQKDPKTFRTSMHMEVVEDDGEGAHDTQPPSENASTIVIQTTPKSPDGARDTPTAEQPHEQRDKPAKPGVWSPWSNDTSVSGVKMEQANGTLKVSAEGGSASYAADVANGSITPGYRPVKFSPTAHLMPNLMKSQAPQERGATTPPSPTAALKSCWNPIVSQLKEQHSPQTEQHQQQRTPPLLPAGTTASPLSTPGTPPMVYPIPPPLPAYPAEQLPRNPSGLPPSQSPTVTLLQKAREGQIPKGAVYIDDHHDNYAEPRRSGARSNEPYMYDQRVTVDGDRVHTDTYYAMPTAKEVSSGHRTTIPAPPKYEGIGPTINGIPVGLRTERRYQNVKDEHASDWYKTMFKRLHKYGSGDYQTVVDYRRRGNQHSDGYMSEPDFSRDDDRPMFGGKGAKRAINRSYANSLSTMPGSYKIQPRSIEDYEPGHSSIAEREAAFSSRYLPPLDTPKPKYTLSDGYESDSTLIRKTGSRMNHLDSRQQREWYKAVQRGEDIPLEGLGKAAPQKPPAQLHRYLESQVNIHYQTPVCTEEKEYIDEEELRRRQEAAMRKFYEDEFHKKQQRQSAELEMRRHNDNLLPSQKSPIPLDRYENSFEPTVSRTYRPSEPKTLAKVLYNFFAQSPKEINLRKGDLVYIRRKVDTNWYEGEHHGLVGIFPVSYVEVIPAESAHLQPKRALEGLARAKFNFSAQTPAELSLFRGETVVLVRRVDPNWYEGRMGTKRGICPAAYLEVISEPQEIVPTTVSPKPPASPVYGPIVSDARPQRSPASYSPQSRRKESPLLTSSALHVDSCEPISYRVLYSYRPQHEDELELREGDTVLVIEKCDDGWYLGSSLRTGLFGTFPGNYVERI